MEYAQALRVAQRVLEELKPHCDRIAIAGSLRRKCPVVKDIEIVCIPKPYDTGLFASGIAKVLDRYPVIKGHLPCKYTQRQMPEGINIDVFMVQPGNWGLHYAIRTGPADYSHKVLATQWVKRGFQSVDGWLTKNGKPIGILEEQDLFRLIGLEFKPAEKRMYRGV